MLPALAGDLTTAVEDELILKNPWVLQRAGMEKAPEGPVATIEQVYALAGAPRSEAGQRTVTFPQAITPDVEAHLAARSAPGRRSWSAQVVKAREPGSRGVRRSR